MSILNAPAPAQTTPFLAAVRTRSWDWLFQLRRRLHVAIQLVDEDYAPVFQPEPGPVSTALSEMLSSGRPDLRTPITAALHSRTPQLATIDRLQVVCVGVGADRVAPGALVLVRDEAGMGNHTAAQGQTELELIGSWLSGPIEAHLTSLPTAGSDSLSHVAALCRLLTEASRLGTEQDVVSAFADAMAVWNDMEVYGYLQDRRGQFVRVVSLPGADLSRTPALIDAAGLLELSDFVLLSNGDAQRLAFTLPHQIVVATLSCENGEASWLIAFSGVIGPNEFERLNAYVKLLEHWLARVVSQSVARLTGGLALQLLSATDDLETGAARALDEVVAGSRASAASLAITLPNGRELLHVGNHELFTVTPDPVHLVTVNQRPGRCTTALALERGQDGPPFGRSDQRMADTAAGLLALWAEGLLQRSRQLAERRADGRDVDRLMERFAEQALADNVPVIAVVISAPDARFQPGLVHQWVAKMRAHVRTSDRVGLAGDTDIGLLLYDTTAAQALTVASRMRGLLPSDTVVSPSSVALGLAMPVPGAQGAGELLNRARQDGVRRSALDTEAGIQRPPQ